MMGGVGSGREKESETISERLMSEQEFVDNVTDKTVQDYNTVVSEMMAIITGEAKEFVMDCKTGTLREKPPSLDHRIKAAKVWKELTLDKVVANKKELGDNGDQGKLFDYNGLVKSVSSVMEDLKVKQVKGVAE